MSKTETHPPIGYETGAKVNARYNGGTAWYPGIISRVYLGQDRVNWLFDVEYDDGDFESQVVLEHLKPVESTAGGDPKAGHTSKSTEEPDTCTPGEDIPVLNESFTLGSKVEARYSGGEEWYPGAIAKVRYTNERNRWEFSVAYDDGDYEDNVPEIFIRVPLDNSAPVAVSEGTESQRNDEVINSTISGINNIGASEPGGRVENQYVADVNELQSKQLQQSSEGSAPKQVLDVKSNKELLEINASQTLTDDAQPTSLGSVASGSLTHSLSNTDNQVNPEDLQAESILDNNKQPQDKTESVEKQTKHNSIDNELTNDIGGGSSSKTSDEAMPNEASDEAMPNEASDEAMPNEASDEAMPNEASDEAVPNEASNEGTQSRIGDEGMPNEASDEAMPNEAGDNGMENEASNEGTQSRVGDEAITNEAGDKGMENEANDEGTQNRVGGEGRASETSDEAMPNEASDGGIQKEAGHTPATTPDTASPSEICHKRASEESDPIQHTRTTIKGKRTELDQCTSAAVGERCDAKVHFSDAVEIESTPPVSPEKCVPGASPTDILKTRKILRQVIAWPALTDKLLSRPPFLFLRDVIAQVFRKTSFAIGLYSRNEVTNNTCWEKKSKVAFLEKTLAVIEFCHNEPLNHIRSTKIAAGKLPNTTLYFLRHLSHTAVKFGAALVIPSIRSEATEEQLPQSDTTSENSKLVQVAVQKALAGERLLATQFVPQFRRRVHSMPSNIAVGVKTRNPLPSTNHNGVSASLSNQDKDKCQIKGVYPRSRRLRIGLLPVHLDCTNPTNLEVLKIDRYHSCGLQERGSMRYEPKFHHSQHTSSKCEQSSPNAQPLGADCAPIQSDIPQGGTDCAPLQYDIQQGGTDCAPIQSDIQQGGTACAPLQSDIQQAGLHHTPSQSDIQQAGQDHTLSQSDFQQAGLHHTPSQSDIQQAGLHHTPSQSDIQQAGLHYKQSPDVTSNSTALAASEAENDKGTMEKLLMHHILAEAASVEQDLELDVSSHRRHSAKQYVVGLNTDLAWACLSNIRDIRLFAMRDVHEQVIGCTTNTSDQGTRNEQQQQQIHLDLVLPSDVFNCRRLPHVDLVSLSGFGYLHNIHLLLQLPSLRKLVLSGNALSVLPVPDAFQANLCQINELRLDRNRFCALDVSGSNFPFLTHLDLSQNRLQQIPSALCEMERLRVADLSRNNIRNLPEWMLRKGHGLSEQNKTTDVTLHLANNPLQPAAKRIINRSRNQLWKIIQEISLESKLQNFSTEPGICADSSRYPVPGTQTLLRSKCTSIRKTDKEQVNNNTLTQAATEKVSRIASADMILQLYSHAKQNGMIDLRQLEETVVLPPHSFQMFHKSVEEVIVRYEQLEYAEPIHCMKNYNYGIKELFTPLMRFVHSLDTLVKLIVCCRRPILPLFFDEQSRFRPGYIGDDEVEAKGDPPVYLPTLHRRLAHAFHIVNCKADATRTKICFYLLSR